MNQKFYILVFFNVLFFQNLTSQDLHFSQFFANPISFNPAQTGFFKGSYRLGANHKQQWPWAIDGQFLNYNTSSAFVDFSVLDKKINDYDWAGIGFNFINDIAGDGNLSANKAYFSFAYHKGLDRFHKQFLSIGFTFGYVHRAINFSALYFNNQWVERVGFDLTLPSFENLDTEKTGYLDIGVGIKGSNQIGEKINLNYGFSWLHLNRPKESYYNQSNRLGLRTLFHFGVEYQVSEKVSLTGSGYFTYQKKAKEIVYGLLASFKTHTYSNKKTSKFFTGVFYRNKDALSPIFGYQYHNTRILLNYDINLSSLTKASRGNGGFEFSLLHTGTFKKKGNLNKKIYCPKF